MSVTTRQRDLNDIRDDIRRHYLVAEADVVPRLAGQTGLDRQARRRVSQAAANLVATLRTESRPGLMESFLAEYGLSTEEGVALMCLAEALLRVPDETNIDALIRDKIGSADWGRHIGQSGSPLVNASTWGLMLTGKVVGGGPGGAWDILGTLQALVRRAGEPVIRRAVGEAMKIMGHQFVLGRGIEEAMERARKNMEPKGYSYSYDMLGEAARTEKDARGYFLSYSQALSTLAQAAIHDDIRANPGLSVKLSALHPRYEFGQRDRAMAELTPRIAALATHAKNARMGLNIDAEEADRLDLSLDVIETVLSNPDLAGWDGFGVVVQAYGPRAPHVIDWLHALAARLDRRIMVRLVKGAYWDTEIKRAQVMGLDGYPVFTRKVSTDLSYLACARKLLDCSDRIYPQFATHNAHTAAAILEMAGDFDGFEFQRLHGMGEALYELLRERHGKRCRIYAPVGVHRDLLAYLVRRLLENGANSSFVNQVLNTEIPVEDVAADPIEAVAGLTDIPNSHIPLPPALYAPGRRNSRGWDITDPVAVAELDAARGRFAQTQWRATPIIDGAEIGGTGEPVLNPANHNDTVGAVIGADKAAVARALDSAERAAAAWRNRPADQRAVIVERIADLYEANAPELMALAAREAGKTLLDGVAEVREAVDFCRYYAAEARRQMSNGKRRGRGVFVCISPWNFPLAIFTGQIAAALAAGNTVIAKPAEQTPLIAARAIRLMHEAGVPGDVLHLLPGDGPTVGGPLVSDPRIAGVCFTGSTDTAKLIHRALAEAGNADATLIAETGGLNAMIVDSTALHEQAVRDIVASAFQSAGQRCSALRLLCVQEDVAGDLLAMLSGAMAELSVGDPWLLSTDIGPVIDREALDGIAAHCDRLEAEGRLIAKTPMLTGAPDVAGSFIAPAAYRLDNFGDLTREVFGPVLHVVTFKATETAELVDRINASGFGLTLGLHSRIDRRVQDISGRAHVGNIYVNRNQIGAVVGVQPFGGEGLSGTGPKAGGPHYLTRFTEAADGGAESGDGADATGPAVDAEALSAAILKAARSVESWGAQSDRIAMIREAAKTLDPALAKPLLDGAAAVEALDFGPITLPGPTGESNRLSLHPRGVFLGLASGGDPGRIAKLTGMALAAGNGVVLCGTAWGKDFAKALKKAGVPADIVAALDGVAAPATLTRLPVLAGVITDTGETARAAIRRALAARDGAIVALITKPGNPALFVAERSLSIDTTASGGNASLLADAEG